jgi:hypothetical protein
MNKKRIFIGQKTRFQSFNGKEDVSAWNHLNVWANSSICLRTVS